MYAHPTYWMSFSKFYNINETSIFGSYGCSYLDALLFFVCLLQNLHVDKGSMHDYPCLVLHHKRLYDKELGGSGYTWHRFRLLNFENLLDLILLDWI